MKIDEREQKLKLNSIDSHELVLLEFKQYINSLSYILKNKELKNIENPKSIPEAQSILESIEADVASAKYFEEYDKYMENRFLFHDLVPDDDQVYIVVTKLDWLKITNSEPLKYFDGLPEFSRLYYASQLIVRDKKAEELKLLNKEIEDKIVQAEELATRYDLTFSLYTSYGMGGDFENGSWHPSSESC